MRERNIKIEILDVDKFYNKARKLDQKGLRARILAIYPSIIVISICFSETLDLRFALEVEGIFPELRMKQDLCMVTNGKQIELDETQRELLYTISEPANIEKLTVIHGPEGSGKTILSMEVLKMKLSHYIRKFKLNARRSKEKIRVFICGFYTGSARVPVLLRQMYNETRDISEFCTLQFKPMPDVALESILDFQSMIETIAKDDSSSFIKTI